MSFTAGKDQSSGTLQAMHHAYGDLPHLLDHDDGRFQAPARRQRFADLAAAQRRALSLTEDVASHALAFARPKEAAPHSMSLGPDRPQIDFRGKQLEGRVEVGQIIRQTFQFSAGSARRRSTARSRNARTLCEACCPSRCSTCTGSAGSSKSLSTACSRPLRKCSATW